MPEPDEERKKPEPFPPAVSPIDEDDEEEESTLPPEVAEAEAERVIHEIEDEEPASVAKRRPPPAPGPAGPTFIDRAWEVQYRIESRFRKIGRGKYSRVLKMARKPERDEFVRAAQITALGILIIGIIGFIILLSMGWLMRLLGVK